MTADDSRSRLRAFLIEEVTAMLNAPAGTVDGGSNLIGRDRLIKSFQLVELLLAVEDHCRAELGFDFDWESDSALSDARSFLRTIDSFADHLAVRAAGTQ